MKTIASLAIATLTFIATPAVQAHDHGHKIIVRSHNHIHNCAPRFICTREVSRRIESHWAYDSFGHPQLHNVMVITYANYYSDGSTRCYTRTVHM